MPNYQPLYRHEHYYYYYYYHLQSILLFLDTVKYCKVSAVKNLLLAYSRVRQNHFVTCVPL
jgi:hypothetical protein